MNMECFRKQWRKAWEAKGTVLGSESDVAIVFESFENWLDLMNHSEFCVKSSGAPFFTEYKSKDFADGKMPRHFLTELIKFIVINQQWSI